ncbi:MAG: Ada metal-binding domain-containing protein [Gammaproteobacteria bacterium]
MKKADIYYEAMKTRDHRFDGKFFVGVKTTGIYCRPICPAKPKRENVEFFHSRYEAESKGYRPCMRCRPESAPQSPAWIGKSAVVQRAIKVLHARELLEFKEDEFAAQFGVTARHLRRLFIEEIGKTPKQLSFENRLNLARKLIVETTLPMTEVAFAAGFSSIRRFNDAFKDRFKKIPREVRRHKVVKGAGINISLSYRPPFDFEGLMASYKNHRMGDLEWFGDGKMHRIITMNNQVGKISIENNAKKSCLIVTLDFPDTSIIHAIISRVRAMFDLDSDPVVIANVLDAQKDIKKLLKKYPGIRLPSGWNAFELSISTILGQLVSVKRGRELVHQLMEIAGSEIKIGDKTIKNFPTAEQIINTNLTKLKTTTARKVALVEFSKAIIEKRISLEPTQAVDMFLKNILSLKGIGPWTANYIALKVLRDTDIFPASDLILARAVDLHSKEIIDAMSPWRGYVAALFWRTYAGILKKKEEK